MTEREIARMFKENQPPAPQGFEPRHDFLLFRLTGGTGEKRVVKRKLSVGLVFIIALILAAATAWAAIRLRAYYERTIEQTAQSGLVQDWNADEKVRLVNWMIEAGIELDTEKAARLRDGGLPPEQRAALAMEIISGYYPARQGALTVVDIIAKEKGPYETWSIEDKAWLTRMLYQYGEPAHSSLYFYNLLPDGALGDITLEDAVFAARDVLKRHYALSDGDLDEMGLNAYFVLAEDMSYLLPGETERREGRLRLWMIRYIPNGTRSEYWVNMRHDGVVLDWGEPAEPAVAYDAKSVPPNEVLDRYRDIYGEHRQWAMETWISFQEDLSLSAEVFGGLSDGLACVLMQRYLIPGERLIPRQEVMDAMFARMQAQIELTPQEREQEVTMDSAVLLMDGDVPVWKVQISRWDLDGEYFGYYWEADARTGEIRSSYTADGWNDSWYEPYVLERTLPDPAEDKGVG